MPRVLFVEEALYDNGHMRIVLDTMRHLAAQCWDASLISVREPVSSGTLDMSDIDLTYATKRPGSLFTTAPAALTSLVRAARRCEVVISGGEVGMGVVLGAAAATIARRPFAIWAQAEVRHSAEQWMPGRTRQMLWHAYRSADGVATLTPSLLANVRELAPQALLRVIGPPFDAAAVRFMATADGPVPHFAQTGPIICGIGRLTDQKGFDALLDAMALVVRDGTAMNLVLVGDGEREEALRAQAAELGLTERVVFTGHLANPFPVLAQAEAFVLPSRFEGYALVLQEALALGVPVIAADCPAGPSDVLDGGRWGRLLPVDNVEALATALNEHLHAPAELRSRATARCQEPFPTAEDSATAMAGFLHDLSAASRPVVRRAQWQSRPTKLLPGDGAPSPGSSAARAAR